MANSYIYAGYKADNSDRWHLLPTDQVDEKLEKPAFRSVMTVSHDVEGLDKSKQDVRNTVKYFGPMHFDLDGKPDGSDRQEVLDSCANLLDRLHSELGIEKQYIHCWLTGSKGVHITVPAEIFGVKKPQLRLPWVWNEIARELFVPFMDMSIYSLGRGRMWRTENMERPNGKFKVPVTFDELHDMTIERYDELVSAPRYNVNRPELKKSTEYMEASRLGKQAMTRAKQRFEQFTKAEESARESDYSEWSQVPGCVDILITRGDCEASNWNQASMQLAGWIGARFSRDQKDEYMEQLVEPFLQNVKSSSRSLSERRKSMDDQLKRAFSGHTKFSIGGLIATTGTTCGNCECCNPQMRPGDQADKLDLSRAPSGVKRTSQGYFMELSGDREDSRLTSWQFEPHSVVMLREEDSEGNIRENRRLGFMGTLIDDDNTHYTNFWVPEEAFQNRAIFVKTFGGMGASCSFVTENDLQQIEKAILFFSGLANRELMEGEEPMRQIVNTQTCGIIFQYPKGQDGPVVPHYVEKSGSEMGRPGGSSVVSNYQYVGDRHSTPSLRSQDFPYEDDEELREAIINTLKINDPDKIAMMVGWACAAHLREHIQLTTREFPLLNVWGPSSSGKSSATIQIMMLCGYDFTEPGHEPLNCQTASSVVPLMHYLASSTTVPRMLEEYNLGGEAGMSNRRYYEFQGLMMSTFNREATAKGKLQKGGRGGSAMEKIQLTSPTVFLSESRPTRTAFRNRTMEVFLTVSARERDGREESYNRAHKLRRHLLRAAKVMVNRALATDPRKFTPEYLEENYGKFIPKNMDTRTRNSLRVIFLGLDYFAETMKEDARIDIDAEVDILRRALTESLGKTSAIMDKEKRTSEVSRVIQEMNRMAGLEAGSGRLIKGVHYYRIGNTLSLQMDNSFTPLRAHYRSVSKRLAFADVSILNQQLEHEKYFLQTKFVDGRLYHELDISKAQEADIDTGFFKPEDDI